MFFLIGYTNWSGGIRHTDFEMVTPQLDFCCVILDTSDNVEEQLTRAQLEDILRANPRIKIGGIVHENGILKSIYAYRHASYEKYLDYTVLCESITERGSYGKITVFKKGLERPIAQFTTTSETGYEWSLGRVAHNGDFLAIEVLADYGKRRGYDWQTYGVIEESKRVYVMGVTLEECKF